MTANLEARLSESQAHLEHDCQFEVKGPAGAVKVILVIQLIHVNIFNKIEATLNLGCIVGQGIFLDTFVRFFPSYYFFISLTSY